MELISSLDDRVVVWGMSCVGKTTFAKQLTDHHYHCFDALFQWHIIEAMGLSTEANLRYISNSCTAERYVLDGWHLSDSAGELLPDARVYVVYAPYDRIVEQYRVPVLRKEEHWPMFKKWYFEMDYPSLRSRYFLNEGHHNFAETSEDDFLQFLRDEMKSSSNVGMS
jgi:adenylate kinase family enzyme